MSQEIRNKLKPLSNEEIEKRKPLPPEILANAIQDPIPRKIGRLRIAKTVGR